MSSESASDERPARPTALWSMRALAVVAAGLAAYLTYVSIVAGGRALGCGAGSGCSEVLTSSWSKVLEIPVGVPATLAYLSMLVALCIAGPGSTPRTQRLAWSALVVLAAIVLAAAAWFIGLQAFAVKAFCPWCLADHAVGALLSIAILWTAFRPRVRDGEDAGADDDLREPGHALPALSPRAALACLAGLGLSVAGMMAALQLAFPSAGPPVLRVAETGGEDTGPGPNRTIVLFNGSLRLAPHDLPILGSPDAPKLLVVLFDYCCPHCRKLHGYLERARARYDGQLAIVLLPMPRDPRCNPSITEPDPGFEHACEIARLALAVWRTDRDRFPEFDHWLFDTDEPRPPEAARRQAESLLDPARLAVALEDPWIDRLIKQNVDAYAASGDDRIPVVRSPGIDAIVGRPATESALFDILERDLGLKPAAARHVR